MLFRHHRLIPNDNNMIACFLGICKQKNVLKRDTRDKKEINETGRLRDTPVNDREKRNQNLKSRSPVSIFSK